MAEPTEAQIIEACRARHGAFSMLDGPGRVQMMVEAVKWFKAWERAAQPDTTPAPDQPAGPQPGPQ